MAAAVGLSEATVRRIWHKHGLKPHLMETFKVSTDPNFAEKLEAVVGLYLNPPEHALVLCWRREESDSGPGSHPTRLALKRGRAGTMTHDYKRNGHRHAVCGLNTLNGKVIGLCQERHRHQEWIRFLRLVDQATPDHKQLHLIVDNYATHKHPAVQRWLKRHRRFHIHFTPNPALPG